MFKSIGMNITHKCNAWGSGYKITSIPSLRQTPTIDWLQELANLADHRIVCNSINFQYNSTTVSYAPYLV